MNKRAIITVRIAGIVVGLLLGLSLVFFLVTKQDIVTDGENPEEVFSVDNMVRSNLANLLGDTILSSDINIDTTYFDKNSAGQTLYNGQIIIDGLLANDIPIGSWVDENFSSLQLQRCARKIYLMKPYDELLGVNLDKTDTQEVTEISMENLNIWIENQHYIDQGINNQLFTDEITTALKTFLCVYMDMRNLTEIELIENNNLSLFNDFDIDYSFGVKISENRVYFVGVKTETLGDAVGLNMLYITN